MIADYHALRYPRKKENPKPTTNDCTGQLNFSTQMID